MADLGISFLPGGGGQNQNGERPQPVQQAIKVLSLRLPRVVGANALAPAPLLTSAGASGHPGIDSIVAEVLKKVLPQANQQPTVPTVPVERPPLAPGYSSPQPVSDTMPVEPKAPVTPQEDRAEDRPGYQPTRPNTLIPNIDFGGSAPKPVVAPQMKTPRVQPGAGEPIAPRPQPVPEPAPSPGPPKEALPLPEPPPETAPAPPPDDGTRAFEEWIGNLLKRKPMGQDYQF